MIKRILFAMLLVFVFTTTAIAATVSLSWVAPTINEDGTPLVDLGTTPSYKIYAGTLPNQYNMTFDVLDQATSTTVTIPAVAGERWYFVCTALDLSGNESAYSDEVNTYFPTPEDQNVPTAPGTLIITDVVP